MRPLSHEPGLRRWNKVRMKMRRAIVDPPSSRYFDRRSAVVPLATHLACRFCAYGTIGDRDRRSTPVGSRVLQSSPGIDFRRPTPNGEGRVFVAYEKVVSFHVCNRNCAVVKVEVVKVETWLM